jgi:uncharacterized protein (TIGR02118 family)
MIVRMGMLTRNPDITMEQFRRHWPDVHGPLAAKLPGLRRYHQNHVIDREQRGINYARGPYNFDGVSQLWFDDVPSMSTAFTAEPLQQLGDDEARFIGE